MFHNESVPICPKGQERKEAVLREMLPFVREAYMKSQKIIQAEAIDPKDFVHPYSADVVEKDIAWTEKMRKQHEEKFDLNKAHADIIEAILFQHIEQSNWFGQNASIIKTSHFDDIRNGVDLIVEFEDEAENLLHMGLAIDVTFGEAALQNKLSDIKNDIKNGTLSEIKYFASERSPHKGLYQRLPRVVIGADRSHMFDLMKIWVDDTRKKEFVSHPIQTVILYEIVDQLMHFERYAREHGKADIATVYRKQGMIIQKILRQKGNIDDTSYRKNDAVSAGIKNQLASF